MIEHELAANLNTSLEILIELSNDKNNYVINCAKQNRINRIGLLK